MPRPSLTRFFALNRLDQATADVADARAKLANVESAFQAPHLGPIREELAIADAKVRQAAAAASVMAPRVAKLNIPAPQDGAVALLVAEPGESIVPGQPVMTLQARGQAWTSFNLREDQLDGLTIGFLVELTTADGNAPINAQIDEIVPRGEFATWRAARAAGDHDLNTFVLRADPVGPASEAPKPGMSVWLKTVSQTVQ
jgi:HlyD family secretion protein